MNEHVIQSTEISVKGFWVNLLFSLVVAVGAGALGTTFSSHVMPFYPLLVVAEFAMIIAIQALRRKKSISYGICYGFVTVSGFVTGAWLGSNPDYMNKAGISAVEALVVFGVLAFIAIRTNTIFLKWGRALLAMLIALILVELLGIFVIGLTSVTWMVLSAVGVLIFAGYILYDIQRAHRRGYADSIPLLVISVYLDILNLFLNLLNINVGSKR